MTNFGRRKGTVKPKHYITERQGRGMGWNMRQYSHIYKGRGKGKGRGRVESHRFLESSLYYLANTLPSHLVWTCCRTFEDTEESSNTGLSME